MGHVLGDLTHGNDEEVYGDDLQTMVDELEDLIETYGSDYPLIRFWRLPGERVKMPWEMETSEEE